MMTVYQILCLVGVQGLITFLITRVISKKLDRAEEAAEESKKKAEEARKKSEAIAAGMQALLRDRLLQGYKHSGQKGYADFDDRSNMENLYEQYHALGGNGMMTDMRRAFRALPSYAGGPPTPVDD